MPTVHWKRYTAHCVCLCCCPSGQIWQTLSRRWTGQCGACSTCAATVATQREQRYAKGEIVIDGRGGRKRRCALTTTIASLPVPIAPLAAVAAWSCSCCFTCGFHALSGTSSFTCMTYVTTMRMLGTRGSMKRVGAMLSRQNYLASPFAHCQHRLGVRQSIRHVHVQHLAEVTTVHCPLSTVHDSLVPRATCNELSPPAVTK